MNLNNHIRDIPDFPKAWILFKDITPLLENPEAFSETIDRLALLVKDSDKLVWLDARWFIFASAVAYKLKKPLVLIRKAWKLPYKTIDVNYDLEYGSDSFSMHIDSINPWEKVAIIDDLLATGWTAKAAIDLIEKSGWIIENLNFVIILKELNWIEKFKWYKVNSLVNYKKCL